MAIKTIQIITDDIDGSQLPEDAKPVGLTLDGKSVELYLSETNTKKLSEALAPYLAAGSPSSRAPRQGRAGTGPAPKLVRAWAVANGHQVPSRGRLPKNIVEQYKATH